MLAICLIAALAIPSAPQRGVSVDISDPRVLSHSYARRHAVLIGIDEYRDPAIPDLNYAAADAKAVADILIEQYAFAKEDVRLLIDEDANKLAIDEALEEWACDPDRIGPDDILVVFFAGHGVTRDLNDRGQRGYLIPSDGRTNREGSYAWSSLIGMNDMEDVSEAVPAKHALFLLDSCFGGLAVTRAAPVVTAGLNHRARQVISAGSAEQTVLDMGGGGHSVFTGFLLAALRGEGDSDGDSVVTFGELYNFIWRNVERKTEGRQTPLQGFFPEHEGGNVAFFAPGTALRPMTTTERLKALEQTTEEQLAELKRLADALQVQDLIAEAEALWPQVPELVPNYRTWLSRANELLSRRVLHDKSVRHVLLLGALAKLDTVVVANPAVAIEYDVPIRGQTFDWEGVDPELRWRFETFRELVESLDRLEELVADIQARLDFAGSIEERTISGDEASSRWSIAVESIADPAQCPIYGGLELKPQQGLLPIGRDPQSGLWEFGHISTGELPLRDAETGRVALTAPSGIVLVLIPGGTFWMGTQSEDQTEPGYDLHAQPEEGPVHKVTLSPFFLSKYEMTQGQWMRFTKENPSFFGTELSPWSEMVTHFHPVERVSWDECRRVLRRLALDLPTEAQWEYAARASTSSSWWTGTNKQTLHDAANLADAHCRNDNGPLHWKYEEWNDGFSAHAPVGSFRSNAFGLHDVLGNVSEWVIDGYDLDFFARSPSMNPIGPHDGNALRVIRGGSFDSVALRARSAFRHDDAPSNKDFNRGVRPARSIDR